MTHGTPKPIQMSKILLPTALATAMSPKSCLATTTEDSASGIEVPAARIVTPIMAEGIPKKTLIYKNIFKYSIIRHT